MERASKCRRLLLGMPIAQLEAQQWQWPSRLAGIGSIPGRGKKGSLSETLLASYTATASTYFLVPSQPIEAFLGIDF